jgi:hypothetical protein
MALALYAHRSIVPQMKEVVAIVTNGEEVKLTTHVDQVPKGWTCIEAAGPGTPPPSSPLELCWEEEEAPVSWPMSFTLEGATYYVSFPLIASEAMGACFRAPVSDPLWRRVDEGIMLLRHKRAQAESPASRTAEDPLASTGPTGAPWVPGTPDREQTPPKTKTKQPK